MMTGDRRQRHLKILEIISTHAIHTQEELADALAREGWDVTQSSVSRDIAALHLVKVDGAYHRAALAQRNTALRQQRTDLAHAFDPALASAGSTLVRHRQVWTAAHAEPFTAACVALGEVVEVTLRYRGDESLADPAGWTEALTRAAARDAAQGATTVGPHRHDLELRLDGRLLREVGSTGQQRTAAIALKLCERETLAESSGSEPALLLDDVFAELDEQRQGRLAARLLSGRARQTFITSPREDELPEAFHLETLLVDTGRVSGASRVVSA